MLRIISGALNPSAGTVRLDAADMHGWAAEERGRHIGYLAQDVDVFFGTIAENICRLAEPESESVLAAARLAGIHELVLRLPDGYGTRLGAGGLRLSGGQRQHVGLARALYGEPRLIVLDEPNASLDQEGERALMEAIRAMKQTGATILMAVHGAQLIRLADKVLLLGEGRQQAFGSPNDVMAHISQMVKKAAETSSAAGAPNKGPVPTAPASVAPKPQGQAVSLSAKLTQRS